MKSSLEETSRKYHHIEPMGVISLYLFEMMLATATIQGRNQNESTRVPYPNIMRIDPRGEERKERCERNEKRPKDRSHVEIV